MQPAVASTKAIGSSSVYDSLYQGSSLKQTAGGSSRLKAATHRVCDALQKPPSETCPKRAYPQRLDNAKLDAPQPDDHTTDDLFNSLYWYYTEKGYVNIVLSRCVHLM